MTLVSHSLRWEQSRHHVSEAAFIAHLFSFSAFFSLLTTAHGLVPIVCVSTGRSSLIGQLSFYVEVLHLVRYTRYRGWRTEERIHLMQLTGFQANLKTTISTVTDKCLFLATISPQKLCVISKFLYWRENLKSVGFLWSKLVLVIVSWFVWMLHALRTPICTYLVVHWIRM